MDDDLFQKYIKDLEIESIKIHLQLSVPHDDLQFNEFIGKFRHEFFNSEIFHKTLTSELKEVKNIKNISEFKQLFHKWDVKRIQTQYNESTYNYYTPETRAISFCYVFLKRHLKSHKELFELINKSDKYK